VIVVPCEPARSKSVASIQLVLGFIQVVGYSAPFWMCDVAVAKILKRPVLKHGPRSLTYVQVLR
jgi:hypothetical protein